MRYKNYYRLSELLNEVSTKQEFKAKRGSNVESSNKKEQDKAVSTITKDVERMNKTDKRQRVSQPKKINNDYNKGLLHPNFMSEPSDAWKERVKAQVLGYPSEYNRKHNDYDPALDFSGNENYYKSETERVKRDAKSQEIERKTGLKGNKKTEYGWDYSNKTAIKESVPSKRLVFKNTIFLNENEVIKRVPEDYIIDENRFYMQDKTGTDYLVECQTDPFGYTHIKVVGKKNKQQLNEELSKMKHLAGYKSSDVLQKVDKSAIEDMSETINNFRQLLCK